ncbi:hypothetical protein H4R18_005211 [Coemansia javaensis]|uniref:BZIP domain-containing protein n=1 Tax=Coemansia javaensis TaxID=2761396 RepID=A0A9W8LFX1_9FUNG|nr:hypothetical protein H4R18_005211 [Coemansia javaensis]
MATAPSCGNSSIAMSEGDRTVGLSGGGEDAGDDIYVDSSDYAGSGNYAGGDGGGGDDYTGGSGALRAERRARGSPQAEARAYSPLTARRIRNKLASARMRERQKLHLEELQERKNRLEARVAEMERELEETQCSTRATDCIIDSLVETVDKLIAAEDQTLKDIRVVLKDLQELKSQQLPPQ